MFIFFKSPFTIISTENRATWLIVSVLRTGSTTTTKKRRPLILLCQSNNVSSLSLSFVSSTIASHCSRTTRPAYFAYKLFQKISFVEYNLCSCMHKSMQSNRERRSISFFSYKCFCVPCTHALFFSFRLKHMCIPKCITYTYYGDVCIALLTFL